MIVVAVSGEVDLSTVTAFAAELRRAQRTGLDVVVDLEDVEFMDSSGLAVLVSFAKEAASGATGFSVTPGSRQVQTLFRLSGIEPLLRVASGPLPVP